jgi:rod shape-determining protein MreC
MKIINSRSLQTGFLVLVIVGLVLLALGGYLNPVSRIVLKPFITAQTWVATRFQAVQDFLTAPADLARLRQRNTDLEAENSRLQIQVIELQQQLQEAQVLSALLNYVQERSENRYVAATVIGFDPSPFMKYVLINRGSDDGLRRGMPVVTNQGLIGQIAAVTPNGARVQLITDPASVVNVRLQQADAEGLLTGQLTGEVSVEKIPQSASVQVGDVVVTSGLGGNYPPNLVIGQVTSVRKRDFDLFQSAALQPSADFSSLEIVLIIVNFQPIDTGPLIPSSP